MEPERRCSECGRKIPWGQVHCPYCPGSGGYFWSLRRDTFLLAVFASLIALFVLTGFAVGFYRDVEKGFAEEWYTRGEQDTRANRPEAALTDFRTALYYWNDNFQYQLRLAQALMAAGRTAEAATEARTYLLNLLEREPGDAYVNLQLARLAASDHDVPEALRYYHGAIYGEWTGDVVTRRRGARMELVEFLLQAGERDAARAELIGMAALLPAEPPLQTQVGTMLVSVDGYDDALKLFRQALLLAPRLAPALAGAGECYFHAGDYVRAEHYLSQALQQAPQLPQAEEMLATARAVLSIDPFNRRLRNMERARRAVLAFNTARARLEGCATQKGVDLKAPGHDLLQDLSAQANELQPRARPPDLGRDSELLSQVMDTAFEIEQAAARTCGAPRGLDQALLLLAREQGGTRP